MTRFHINCLKAIALCLPMATATAGYAQSCPNGQTFDQNTGHCGDTFGSGTTFVQESGSGWWVQPATDDISEQMRNQSGNSSGSSCTGWFCGTSGSSTSGNGSSISQ